MLWSAAQNAVPSRHADVRRITVALRADGTDLLRLHTRRSEAILRQRYLLLADLLQ
jgi:hypothetical protein